MALGGEERVGHRAADEQRVDLGSSASMTVDLVGDLGAAEDRDVGLRRLAGQLAQHVELGQEQATAAAGSTRGTS